MLGLKLQVKMKKINISVGEAKTKANEEIQKAQLESAGEVADARQKAADEIKSIKFTKPISMESST